jgi:hypothetical protein
MYTGKNSLGCCPLLGFKHIRHFGCHLLVFKDKDFLSVIASYNRESRDSSGSIVSDYGLDDRAIKVRSPAEAKGFFL